MWAANTAPAARARSCSTASRSARASLCRPGRRPRNHDRGGPRRRPDRLHPLQEAFREKHALAVWLLHARLPADPDPLPPGESPADGGRNPRLRFPATSAGAPAIRISWTRRCWLLESFEGLLAAYDDTLFRPTHQTQRRSPPAHRAGHLHRRRAPAWHVARGLRAQQLCPRAASSGSTPLRR